MFKYRMITVYMNDKQRTMVDIRRGLFTGTKDTTYAPRPESKRRIERLINENTQKKFVALTYNGPTVTTFFDR